MDVVVVEDERLDDPGRAGQAEVRADEGVLGAGADEQVNQRLGVFHPDVASLRRYMVDYGLMSRQSGQYRRAQGSGARLA